MKNNKGFSLVELIVVIAIMAILAAIAIPTFATFINKANVASDESFLNDFEHAAQLAHTATGDKVTNIKVTIAADGTISAVQYDLVDDDMANDVTICTIKFTKDTDWTATAHSATVADDTTTYNDLAEDAKTVIDTVEWEYKFKSEKKVGSWARNTNGDWAFE